MHSSGFSKSKLFFPVLNAPAHGRGLHEALPGAGGQAVQGGAGPGHGQRHRGQPHKGPDEERGAHTAGPGHPRVRQDQDHTPLHRAEGR